MAKNADSEASKVVDMRDEKPISHDLLFLIFQGAQLIPRHLLHRHINTTSPETVEKQAIAYEIA